MSVVAVLPDGEPPGSVPVTRRDSREDLAVSACPVFDLSAVVAGTGLATLAQKRLQLSGLMSMVRSAAHCRSRTSCR